MNKLWVKFLGLALLAFAAFVAVEWDAWQQARLRGQVVAAPVGGGAIPALARELLDAEAPKTVIHAWATWCPPCMVEMSKILDMLQKPHPGVVFVMLNEDDEPETLARFLAAKGLDKAPLPGVRWVHDKEQVMGQALLPSLKLPTTWVYDGTGVLLQRMDGSVDWATFLNVL